MKKVIITYLLLIFFKAVFPQTKRPKSCYDRMSTEEILDYLNNEEEKSFFTCLEIAGIDTCNILWMQKNLLDSLRKNSNYCNVLNLSKNTTEDVVKKKYRKGDNSLLEPQCMIFIIRESFNTHILFQVYY